MKTFKIYRGLAVNKEGELRSDEVGISWTLDEVFADNRALLMADNDFRNEGVERPIVLTAEVTEDDIDWEATCGQMKGDYFNEEFEVILLPNIDITFEIISDEKSYSLCQEDLEGTTISGNTGSGNYDETMSGKCDDEELEELKKEFIEISEGF